MNDKAEVAAAVLVVEAAGGQDHTFLRGVEIFLDNKAVCETCQLIVQGFSHSPLLAHTVWYRTIEKAVARIHEHARVVRFTWVRVPSHTT
jgi:hypothetical protein